MTIDIALGDDFLEAYSDLPRKIQKKAREFMERFRQDPMAATHNYEKVRGSADSNIHSARIDGSYRAILLKPSTGNTYVVLWVDNHDAAYDWAMRRRCKIHPVTGVLQVIPVSNEESAAAPTEEPAPAHKAHTTPSQLPCIFEPFTDRELLEV